MDLPHPILPNAGSYWMEEWRYAAPVNSCAYPYIDALLRHNREIVTLRFTRPSSLVVAGFDNGGPVITDLHPWCWVDVRVRPAAKSVSSCAADVELEANGKGRTT